MSRQSKLGGFLKANKKIVISACVIAILTITGPFGTNESMSATLRFAYWSLVVCFAVVMVPSLEAASRLIFPKLKPLFQEFFALVLFSFLAAPLYWVLADLALENGMSSGPSVVIFWVQVLAISLCIATIKMLVIGAGPVDEVKAPRPRLLDRVGADEGRVISHISSDNHHIKVFLDDGSDHRVLMRLGDAVAEMETVKGVLVHRSHWVACDAISGVFKEGGKDHVLVKTGHSLPISRSGRPHLEAEGYDFAGGATTAKEEPPLAAQ